MTASDSALLDPLASCLGAGVPLADALSRIETAGAPAARWVQRIRPFVRPGDPVEGSLLAAHAIDAAEHAILGLAVTPDDVGRLLHALAVRRRRRESLRVAVLRALVGPLGFAALTVILNPLPNLIGNGSYVGPVLRGLVELAIVTAFVVLGVPAALRSPSLRPRLLEACARLPGLAWLAERHAEAELVTMAAPLVARPDMDARGLVAASTMLAWSPLGERIRAAALANDASPTWALVRLAPHLSLATNLAVVSGTASGELSSHLAARGEEVARELTAHVRLVVRVTAYALVVLFSLGSLVEMVSRGLPGGALLPGGAPSAEQRELDEVMKEMNPPARPAPSK